MPIAQPITWGDIEAATEAAVAADAELAHPPLEIPGRGTFSIFFHGEN